MTKETWSQEFAKKEKDMFNNSREKVGYSGRWSGTSDLAVTSDNLSLTLMQLEIHQMIAESIKK